MKNVLLASPYNQAGGIARWTGHIIAYASCIDEKEVNIDVLHEPRPLFRSFDNKNLLKRILSGIYTYAGYLFNEFLFLKRNECDILHICSSASLGLYKDLLLIAVANWFHKKTIVHFRFGRIPELFEKKNWEYRMLIKVINKANLAITIDKASYNSLKKNGYDKVINIPNPISPDVLNCISNNRNVKRENRLVLFVGQCYKEKGIFELIEACNEIDNITLRFVGSINKKTREEMLDKVKKGIRVEIIGNLPYDQVIHQMQKCSVFVLPTYTEGFPNVILESMACGCPIVTTNVGAIPEMLDIENSSNYGICVKPREVEDLRQAINKMLSDEQYAQQCGKNVKKRVNDLYSMSSVWKQLTEAWNSVLIKA